MYQVFAVSDGTGITAERVVEAALTQFKDQEVEISRYGDVRTLERARQVVQEAAENRSFIVHTLVDPDVRHVMLEEGHRLGVATIDLMGPLLARLTELLSTAPLSEPGLFQPFDEAYLQWIEALKFAVSHDDGRNTHELPRADIVLVGVSRTFKTPLSIYLANQGWRVANVPLILGIEPPQKLFTLPKQRVVATMMQPERLAALRGMRAHRLGSGRLGYADLDSVRREVAYAYELIGRRPDWPIVDMTSKSVEEASAEIVDLLGKRPHR